MSLDEATIRRIAKLARLHVTGPDVTRLQTELSSILGWIEQLNEVDVTAIPPIAATATTALRLRPDLVTTDLTGGGKPDAILANAPDREGRFFAVPKVVE